MKVGEDDLMDGVSNDELFERRDIRKKKDKKRQHKSSRSKDDSSKESFKKMKEELDELRKREIERSKELDDLKKKIEEKELSQQSSETEYELGFDKNVYLSKGFIESAQWVQNTLAKAMIEKMNEEHNQEKFQTLIIAKRSSTNLGYRACARYNRNEECNIGKWHLTHKPDGMWTTQGLQRQRDLQQDHRGGANPRKNELRLHVCTLCLEALGAAMGHRVLDCPWILKKNWSQ